jgi:hypothetical protein
MDEKSNSAVILPAFWFTHNMYAVMRCKQKFESRDEERTSRHPSIEYDPLAPDTIDEIFDALDLIEQHKACVDNCLRSIPLRSANEACEAYKMMVRNYCAKNILPYMKKNGLKSLKELTSAANPSEGDSDDSRCIDCGGTIIAKSSLNRIINKIKSNDVKTWSDVHALFDDHVADYSAEKVRHAVRSMAKLENININELTEAHFAAFLESVPKDCAEIADRTARSRAKDYENPFRLAAYESTEEMVNVLGPAADAVVAKTAEDMARLAALAEELLG